MAKIVNNIILEGVSGKLGEHLVLKVYKGRTVISKKPTFPKNRVFSEAQLAHQAKIKKASAYASSVQRDAVYVAKASGTDLSPYNIALADWLHKPEILEMDLDGWNGVAEGIVRVKARDDVQVKCVLVRFSDTTGKTLEEGQAEKADGLWWEYTAQQDCTGAATATATAIDLPGNRTEMSHLFGADQPNNNIIDSQ